jgi:hypothetical protein
MIPAGCWMFPQQPHFGFHEGFDFHRRRVYCFKKV